MAHPGIAAAQEARKRRLEAGEQIVRLTPTQRAQQNPQSMRAAVNAKCFDCVGGEHADHGYHRAIRDCPSTRCPLHGVRPYRAKGSAAESGGEEDES